MKVCGLVAGDEMAFELSLGFDNAELAPPVIRQLWSWPVCVPMDKLGSIINSPIGKNSPELESRIEELQGKIDEALEELAEWRLHVRRSTKIDPKKVKEMERTKWKRICRMQGILTGLKVEQG